MHLALVLTLGACFGSFFNVCIYRIPMRVPLSMPPSHCYQCGQPLKWYDNIPLLSYWALLGRCRTCGSRFSIRYFLIELLTTGLFAAVMLRYSRPETGYSAVIFPGFIFVSLLIVATFTDIDHWIIPDRISLGGAVAGIILAAITPIASAPHNPLAQSFDLARIPERFVPLANSIAGAAFGFGLLWSIGFLGTLAFRKEAMGRGDMKLFAMFGAFVGPVNCIFILILACFVGSLAGGLGILLARVMNNPMADPAIAELQPDAMRCDEWLHQHDPTPSETLVVTRALTSPGAVGPIRHHLPFGPSLAMAALVVYLAWEPIQKWFFSLVLGQPW